MKRLRKNLSIGTIIWLIIFLLNYVYNLFQINESGIVTTLTGLRITTVMTESELDTTFTLTLQAVIMYLIFISLWLIACYVLSKRQRLEA